MNAHHHKCFCGGTRMRKLIKAAPTTLGNAKLIWVCGRCGFRADPINEPVTVGSPAQARTMRGHAEWRRRVRIFRSSEWSPYE